MKQILILLTLGITIVAAQADLVMELNYDRMKCKFMVNIKGDKVRCDTFFDGGYNMSRIADLNTGENFILDHLSKKIVKMPSILFDQTNAATKAEWPKFEDTGKTEMLNGYEAKIYKWTNSYDVAETLWIAKNYPNFKKIKNDLSKLDKLNDKKLIPELNSLSGMPIKLFVEPNNGVTNRTDVFTLLSAREQHIDDSTFELPKDYSRH